MDTRLRSWVKSIVWRIIGIVLLGGIAYIATGNLKEMTVITILFHSIRLVLYYIYERIWEVYISWGKIKHPLASLPVTKQVAPEDMKIIEEKLRDLGYIE